MKKHAELKLLDTGQEFDQNRHNSKNHQYDTYHPVQPADLAAVGEAG